MQISKPYPYFFFCNYYYKFLTHRYVGSMFLQVVIKNQYFLSSHILHQNLCVKMVFSYSLFFCKASYLIIYLSAYCTGMLLFANCWTRLQGVSTDQFALSDFQKTNIKSCTITNRSIALTHQLICLHRHLDSYWMTGNTCDTSQDCEVDRQSQTHRSKDRRHEPRFGINHTTISLLFIKFSCLIVLQCNWQSWQGPNRSLKRKEATFRVCRQPEPTFGSDWPKICAFFQSAIFLSKRGQLERCKGYNSYSFKFKKRFISVANNENFTQMV